MPVCNLRIEKELVSICNLGFRLFSLWEFYFTAVWHLKLGKRGYSNAVSFSLAIVVFFLSSLNVSLSLSTLMMFKLLDQTLCSDFESYVGTYIEELGFLFVLFLFFFCWELCSHGVLHYCPCSLTLFSSLVTHLSVIYMSAFFTLEASLFPLHAITYE